MKIRFWMKKKPIENKSTEATQALVDANRRHREALSLAERLFASREANHYSERIKAAYELETR